MKHFRVSHAFNSSFGLCDEKFVQRASQNAHRNARSLLLLKKKKQKKIK